MELLKKYCCTWNLNYSEIKATNNNHTIDLKEYRRAIEALYNYLSTQEHQLGEEAGTSHFSDSGQSYDTSADEQYNNGDEATTAQLEDSDSEMVLEIESPAAHLELSPQKNGELTDISAMEVSIDNIVDVAEIVSMIAQDELNNCHNMGIFKAKSPGQNQQAFILTLYLHAIRLHLLSWQFHRRAIGYTAVHLRGHLNIYRALKNFGINFEAFTSHFAMPTDDRKIRSMTSMISHMFGDQATSIISTELLLGRNSNKEIISRQLAEKIKEQIEGNNYTNSPIVFVDVTSDKDTTVTFPNRVLVTAASAASNDKLEKYLYQIVGVLYRRVVSSSSPQSSVFSLDEHFAIQMVTRDGNSVPGVDYRLYHCNSEEPFYETEEKYQTPVDVKPTKGGPMFFPFPTNMLVTKSKNIITYKIHGAVLCLNAGQQNQNFSTDTDSFHLIQDEVVAVVGKTTFQLNQLTPFRQPMPVFSYRLVLPIIHRFAETINQPLNILLSSMELEPLCNPKYHTVDEHGSLKLQESLNKEFCNIYEKIKIERGDEYRCIYTVQTKGSVFHAVIMCGSSWVFVGFCLTEKWIVVNDPCYLSNRSLAAASGILHFIYLEYKTFTGRLKKKILLLQIHSLQIYFIFI